MKISVDYNKETKQFILDIKSGEQQYTIGMNLEQASKLDFELSVAIEDLMRRNDEKSKNK